YIRPSRISTTPCSFGAEEPILAPEVRTPVETDGGRTLLPISGAPALLALNDAGVTTGVGAEKLDAAAEGAGVFTATSAGAGLFTATAAGMFTGAAAGALTAAGAGVFTATATGGRAALEIAQLLVEATEATLAGVGGVNSLVMLLLIPHPREPTKEAS